MLRCPIRGLIVADSLHLALVEGGQGILQRTWGLSQGNGYTNVPQSCGGQPIDLQTIRLAGCQNSF